MYWQQDGDIITGAQNTRAVGAELCRGLVIKFAFLQQQQQVDAHSGTLCGGF